MAKDINPTEGILRNMDNHGERRSTIPNDLPDNDRDGGKLREEATVIEMPDVKDIPGQEFVHAAPMGELADTTISSAGEEGEGIFDDDDDLEEDEDDDSNVSADERQALEDTTHMPSPDEDNLRRAAMDNVDFDGEPLNEAGFGTLQTESDLDIPGGVEEEGLVSGDDEENEGYSVDDTDTDQPAENRSGV